MSESTGPRWPITVWAGARVVEADPGQDLGRADVLALAAVEADARVAYRVQELGGGAGRAARVGAAAPHHGRPASGARGRAPDDGDARGVGRGVARRGRGELHPEAGVVDDDLRGIARHLDRAQAPARHRSPASVPP